MAKEAELRFYNTEVQLKYGRKIVLRFCDFCIKYPVPRRQLKNILKTVFRENDCTFYLLNKILSSLNVRAFYEKRFYERL